METKVKVLVEYKNGNPIFEEILATKIGENAFRIESSPGFAPNLAAGDEIALDTNEHLGYRLLKRNGNICIQIFLDEWTADTKRDLCALFETIGGWLDGEYQGSTGKLLTFTVPVKVGFQEIELVMKQAETDFPIEKWMYGNVYDIKDGVTPLNWWLK